MDKLMLNGTWKLTYTGIEDKNEKWGRWIDAEVPGDVHLDLMSNNIIPEPLISDNNKKCEWIEEKAWWYKKSFNVDEKFIKNNMELVCEGLDMTAELWLNDVSIGTANNMLIEHRFDISKFLKLGINEIVVRLDVGFDSVKDKDINKYSKSWNTFDLRRPWLRKAQQSFYWDVAPRLVTCGIWRDIYIEAYDEAVIRDVYLSNCFNETTASIKVEVDLEYFQKDIQEYSIIASIGDNQQLLNEEIITNMVKGSNRVEINLKLENPKLWWPNGMGDPNLYEVNIEIKSIKDLNCIIDKKSLKYGIRSIKIIEEPINEKEKTFTFEVNGFKVFCKGGDWVPSDSIYARISKDKERKLLELAKDCNFNMMRVWGGGIYPDNNFFDDCDRLGLMVWEDFMFACGYYPGDDKGFCDEIMHEAETIVKKFRNHASLALWCGSNENHVMFSYLGDVDKIFYGKNIFEEILPEVCKKFDANNIYRFSSPWPGNVNEGDQHVWDYILDWKKNAKGLKLWDYAENNHKFVSEFGIFCPSNISSVNKYLGEHPAVPGSEIWELHKDYFEDDFIENMLDMYYKSGSSYKNLSLEESTLAGQMVQAEALKFIFEEFRGRMYVCSGTLYWEYNDTWGYIGYSPVDYYLSIKPLYYYMKRAFAHIHTVFKNIGNEIYLLNDTTSEREFDIEYGCMTFDGIEIIKRRTKIKINPSSCLLIDSLEKELEKIEEKEKVFVYSKVFLNGEIIDKNRTYLVPMKNLELPKDNKKYTLEKISDKAWKMRFMSDSYVWLVNIVLEREDMVISDNSFDLWPGEEKSIYINTEEVMDEIKLKVYSMSEYFYN